MGGVSYSENIVALGSKPVHNCAVDVLVGEESQRSPRQEKMVSSMAR